MALPTTLAHTLTRTLTNDPHQRPSPKTHTLTLALTLTNDPGTDPSGVLVGGQANSDLADALARSVRGGAGTLVRRRSSQHKERALPHPQGARVSKL